MNLRNVGTSDCLPVCRKEALENETPETAWLRRSPKLRRPGNLGLSATNLLKMRLPKPRDFGGRNSQNLVASDMPIQPRVFGGFEATGVAVRGILQSAWHTGVAYWKVHGILGWRGILAGAWHTGGSTLTLIKHINNNRIYVHGFVANPDILPSLLPTCCAPLPRQPALSGIVMQNGTIAPMCMLNSGSTAPLRRRVCATAPLRPDASLVSPRPPQARGAHTDALCTAGIGQLWRHGRQLSRRTRLARQTAPGRHR